MYKVSVIMPVYNNEVTLRRAIESILNQSVFDFELILINDGSTDSSAQICMEYVEREPLLIQLVHQEQSGLAKARNRGLNLAKGSYVYFADAQNTFVPRMLKDNLKLAEEKNAELVVFGFLEAKETIEQIPKLPFLLSKERFRNHYRNFHSFFPYELCNKLYEVQSLKERDIKFRTVPLNEAALFNIDVYRDLNKVVFNRHIYCKKDDMNSDKQLKFKKNHWDLHLYLISHLRELFTYWNLIEEYEDLIIREYYLLLKEEIINLSSSDLNLSTLELEKEINHLLQDERIRNVLAVKKQLTTKSLYERTLWNNFRKQNVRVIISLINSKKQTNKLTGKLKGKFNKWFND